MRCEELSYLRPGSGADDLIVNDFDVPATVRLIADEDWEAMLAVVQAVAAGDVRSLYPDQDRWILAFDNPTLSYAMEVWQQARKLVAEHTESEASE